MAAEPADSPAGHSPAFIRETLKADALRKATVVIRDLMSTQGDFPSPQSLCAAWTAIQDLERASRVRLTSL
jgi:hypothetical protein